MAAKQNPNDIIKAIQAEIKKDAKQLGVFVERRGIRVLPDRVRQDLHNNPEALQSFFEGAEEVQKGRKGRERSS